MISSGIGLSEKSRRPVDGASAGLSLEAAQIGSNIILVTRAEGPDPFAYASKPIVPDITPDIMY